MYGQDIEFVAVAYLLLMGMIGLAAFLEWLSNRRD